MRLLKAAILVELLRRPTTEMTENEMVEFWISLDTELIPEQDREFALASLVEEGLIVPPVPDTGFYTEHTYYERQTDYYALTSSGLAKIQADMRKKNSIIYKRRALGEPWLRQELEYVYSVLMDSRLSALPGQPSQEVDFTSQAKLQNEVLGKLDQLINAINANNAFRQGDPTNHAAVSDSLKLLSSELSKGKTTVGKIEAAGYGALSFIALKFADTVVGAIATDVWALVTKLIHLVL